MRHRPPSVLLLIAAALLLVTGLLFWYFTVENNRNTAYFLEVTTERVHKEIRLSLEELSTVEPSDELLGDFRNPTLIYRDGEVSAWSDFRLVPPLADLEGGNPIAYLEFSQGKYLKTTRQLEDGAMAYQLIGLYSTPPFNNQYIRSAFNYDIFPQATISIDQPDMEDSMILSPDGEPLFGVKFDVTTGLVNEVSQAAVALTILASLLLTFVYLNSWSWYVASKGLVWRGVVILLAGLVGMRGVMLTVDFPFSIYALDLFNPRFYASSVFNPSLGDLLLNMMVVLSLTTFLFRYVLRTDVVKLPDRVGKVGVGLFLLVINLLGLYALSFHYGLLEDILVNSQIELDINKSLEFSRFRIISMLIFFASSVVWFQVTHFLYSVSIQAPGGLRSWITSYLVACAVFALAGWLARIQVGFILGAQSIYLILAYLFKLPEYLTRSSYSTIFYFFAATMISSVVGTIAIYKWHEYEERVDKRRFANDLLLENDLKGEYLIEQAVPKIQEDIFIQSRMMSAQISKSQIQEKIVSDYLGGYFDKYDIRVRLFDRDGKSFTPVESDSLFADIQRQYEEEDTYKTDYPALYFTGKYDPSTPNRYVKLITMRRYDRVTGYVILDLRLKKVIPQTVFPELLADSRFVDNHRSFDYAFYNNQILDYKTGTYNYENLFEQEYFQEPRLFVKGIERDGYHHYGIQGADNRVLIITSEVYPTSFIVANFSFVFLFIFVGVLILQLGRVIYRTHAIRLHFVSKIQLYLNLAFFVPLGITSVVIITTLNSSYQAEIDRSSIKNVNSLKDHMVSAVDDFLRNKINREDLSIIINQIARYSKTDLTLYDIEGKLITSSQPSIFANQLLSTRINPHALSLIMDRDLDEVVLNESVGQLAYKSTYAAVKSFDNGELMAIVGAPFFGSKNHLQRQTNETFTSILNVFTIVLIASLFFSNLASRLLTHPLNLLTQKIRKTSLAEHNEPLQWKENDEIGMVVQEYNKMLVNLEASKEALAKSQKESAWREIAKQVAHEIKNPLTPMKLSLQHLKRITASDKVEGKEMEKPIDNLLYQIDSLSDIATSFSAFAKMPIPENERFELGAEVKRAAELFANEKVELTLEMEDDPIYVNGDQKLMGRIISNLIINGMQSVDEDQPPMVAIKVTSDEKRVTIEVKDNGAGIPEDIQGKVFIPNFSTKETGSGIGLAVAKRGIEHAGGNIWFETTSDQGTSFFVSLPLIT